MKVSFFSVEGRGKLRLLFLLVSAAVFPLIFADQRYALPPLFSGRDGYRRRLLIFLFHRR